MNVLPIVFSILMLLAIMTYSQLQTFLFRSQIRKEYTCYLENRSRNSVNSLQENLYDSLNVKGKSNKNPSDHATALSFISIHWFLDEPRSDQHWSYLQANNEIVRRLFDIIYGDRKFYREAEEKRPDIVNEVWQAVIEELKEKKAHNETLGKIQHIANLQLQDPVLAQFWAQLLKYDETPESIEAECGSKEVKDVQKTVSYYPNLLDFLTNKKITSQSYRVWLLKKPLLMAIFQDEGVANDIIRDRRVFYNELDKAEKNHRGERKQDLEIKFENLFKNKIPSDIPQGMVNFQVSLSRPPK